MSLNKKANHIARNPITGADIKSIPTPEYQLKYEDVDWASGPDTTAIVLVDDGVRFKKVYPS
jgi:hypothetical protein